MIVKDLGYKNSNAYYNYEFTDVVEALENASYLFEILDHIQQTLKDNQGVEDEDIEEHLYFINYYINTIEKELQNGEYDSKRLKELEELKNEIEIYHQNR